MMGWPLRRVGRSRLAIRFLQTRECEGPPAAVQKFCQAAQKGAHNIVEVAGGMLCARMPRQFPVKPMIISPMPGIVANAPTSATSTREPDFVFSIIGWLCAGCGRTSAGASALCASTSLTRGYLKIADRSRSFILSKAHLPLACYSLPPTWEPRSK
jgi:hypothetical protein